MRYKKSITIIGKNLFVHGGVSHALMSKYSIHELNQIVQKWLLKQGDERQDKIFDEVFRDDDDMCHFGVDCIVKMMVMVKILKEVIMNM